MSYSRKVQATFRQMDPCLHARAMPNDTLRKYAANITPIWSELFGRKLTYWVYVNVYGHQRN